MATRAAAVGADAQRRRCDLRHSVSADAIRYHRLLQHRSIRMQVVWRASRRNIILSRTRRNALAAACLLLCLIASQSAPLAAGDGADVSAAAISHALRQRLENRSSAGYIVAGERMLFDDVGPGFYQGRDYRPLWVSSGARAANLPDRLYAAILDAADHGLSPWRYHASAISELLGRAGKNALDYAALELLLTDAFIAQVVHRSAGVLNPLSIDETWLINRSEVDPFTLLEQVATGEPPEALLEALWPEDPDYRVLLAEKQRLRSGAAVEREYIPPGAVLQLGMHDRRVPALRRRFGLAARPNERMDGELSAAIAGFQELTGLEPDGVLGPATLTALNRTRAELVATLDANLERLRWLPQRRPSEHIRINIADYSLVYDRHGVEVLNMDVIVGMPYRRTPVFTETMKYVVFNPDWSVPRKIAVQDKLPQLRRDPVALAALGYEAAPLATPKALVSVTDIDWNEITGFPFRLRQRPGPQNTLGRVKLMLPNPYAVYLHDTSSRELFDRTERSFSSGCIRLSRPLDLAELVLANQPGWTRSRIDAAVASGQTVTAYLKEPVPVYFLYFTAFADNDGRVRYRRDIYDRDGRVIEALGLI
jgi:L,D-transpeptidase YcbB